MKTDFDTRKFLKPNNNLSQLVLITLAIFVAMSLVSPDKFLRYYNFQSISFMFPEIGLLSIAMMIAMLTGGIDLSIVGIANLSSILAGVFFLNTFGKDPDLPATMQMLNVGVGVTLALCVGAMAGALNGFLITRVRITPILATIGTVSYLAIQREARNGERQSDITILSEALMSFCNVPSAYLKKQFGFEYLPDFNKKKWLEIKSQSHDGIKFLPPGLIEGSDILRKAVHATKENLEMLPEGSKVKVNLLDFRKTGYIEKAVIVCNPPYGIRLGEESEMPTFYKTFGSFLREKCQGCEAFIYFGEPKYIKNIEIEPSWSKPLKNGGLDGRLVKFRL